MSESTPFTVAVFCGSAPGFEPVFIETARAVGRAIAAHGMSLVYGGGHVGLMGAVSDAALDAGAHVTGVIPAALRARESVSGHLSELVLVESMHERKTIMSERADAFLALPGGPGTLEEFAEQWTWAQLGIHEKPSALLNVDGYFDPLLAFIAQMRDRGFTHPRYTDMIISGTDVDGVLESLRSYVPPARHHLSPGAEMVDSADGLRP